MITSIHTSDLHISQYIHEKDHASSYLFYTINTCACYWHLDLLTITVGFKSARVPNSCGETE